MSASVSPLPSWLLLKVQVRYILAVDKLGSSDHLIFAVDPSRKVKMFPSGGRMICPENVQYFKIGNIYCHNYIKGKKQHINVSEGSKSSTHYLGDKNRFDVSSKGPSSGHTNSSSKIQPTCEWRVRASISSVWSQLSIKQNLSSHNRANRCDRRINLCPYTKRHFRECFLHNRKCFIKFYLKIVQIRVLT